MDRNQLNFVQDKSGSDLNNWIFERHFHEEKYLDVCKYFRQIYDTPSIKENESQLTEVNGLLRPPYTITLESQKRRPLYRIIIL